MKRLLLFLLLFILITPSAYTQSDDKSDVILMLNGEEKIGKVLEMGDNEIKFSYKGETLTYNIKRQDILRITFASGRIEVINKPSLPSEGASEKNDSSRVDTHNKVAILPIALIVDNGAGSDAMSSKIQVECYNIMSRKAATLSFQDPNTTNALLIRNNITDQTIKGYTMDELCHILGVEYVVQNIVTLNKTSAVSSSSYNAKASGSNNSKNNDVKASGSSYSTTTQNYQTSITMNVFDEHGSKVFGKDHASFWQTQDAYKITLEFLAKKTPLYQR